MTALPATDTLFRARLYTSEVIHLIDFAQPSHPDASYEEYRRPALCNIKPVWPGIWIEDNDGLLICKNCTNAKEASERVGQP